MAKQKIDTSEVDNRCKRWHNSIGMKIQSVSDKSPTLASSLVTALTTKQSKKYLGLTSKPDVSAKPIIGTLLSIILYQRRPRNLTGFQELYSLLQMWLAGCKRGKTAYVIYCKKHIGYEKSSKVIIKLYFAL